MALITGTASTALVVAVSATISAQMATALVSRKANVECDVSVISALTQEGFGVRSIKALRRCAVVIARQMVASGRV